MEAAFVEEVAASLIREFLSKKGLKKTSIMMDEEFPRTALSINNRNELRTVLHLHALYKENKTKETPLRTLLEIMTNYFLDVTKSTKDPPVPNNKMSQHRCVISKNSLSDEETCRHKLPETNRNDTFSYDIGDNTHPTTFPKRHLSNKSEKSKPEAPLGQTSPTENKLPKNLGDIRTPEQALEARVVMKEKFRAKPGLIARGMMAGPTATSEEDSLKRRHLKLSSGLTSKTQLKGDGSETSFGVPSDGIQDSKGTSKQPLNFLPSRSERSKDRSSMLLFGPFTSTDGEKTKIIAKGNEDSFAKPIPGRHQAEEQKPESSGDTDMDGKSQNLQFLQIKAGARSQKKERKREAQFSNCRKTPKSISSRGSVEGDELELVDVEDEATVEEVCTIFDISARCVLQITSKPIDFFLARSWQKKRDKQFATTGSYPQNRATESGLLEVIVQGAKIIKDLKALLFGSSLGCFSEEWRIQSFTFSDIPQLKYGIVQKKGGPCGVLAAVQACVLKHLIFGDSHRNSDTCNSLQTSEAHRTKCLTLALTDILWRAGSWEKAVVVLCTGTEQFTPAGKYKADGILETKEPTTLFFLLQGTHNPMQTYSKLMLHTVTNYEDLLKFLQQNISQFEAGPYGCILFTLSVILSRSVDQVRRDFDVFTNCLIGAHGYCTQELINLLLTGKAASNVFNDRVELDSGNGNITILKGVSSRSDVGLLSLFEHYEVCQVGCYLKTPKFPIWVICSESHFSVLFCLNKDLLGDWKMERRFDLYYYDGLANQQEEIHLTIDTSQPYIEDKDNDLIPPLEHCIRTKWKGAVVNWNGTEPIL